METDKDKICFYPLSNVQLPPSLKNYLSWDQMCIGKGSTVLYVCCITSLPLFFCQACFGKVSKLGSSTNMYFWLFALCSTLHKNKQRYSG